MATVGSRGSGPIRRRRTCCAARRAGRCSPARSTTADRDRRWDLIAAEIDRPTPMARAASWLRLAVGTPELMVSAAGLARRPARRARRAVDLQPARRDRLVPRRSRRPFPSPARCSRTAPRPIPAGEIAVAVTAAHVPDRRDAHVRRARRGAADRPAHQRAAAVADVEVCSAGSSRVCALCAVVLAAGTRFDPAKVGAALVIGWAGFVMTGFYRQRRCPDRRRAARRAPSTGRRCRQRAP